MPYEFLSKERILAALHRLGELAHAEGVRLEISLYGGAVFALVYGSRDATKDVDALVRPSKLAQRLATQVAREQGLVEDWLNDDVRQFLAVVESKRPLTQPDFGPGLQVTVPSAAYLLALKLRACRRPLPGYSGDFADIRFLLGKMNLHSVEDAEAVFARFFPEDALPESTREAVASLLRELEEKR